MSPAATVSVIGRRSPRSGMIVYEPGSSGVSPPTECTLTEPSPHSPTGSPNWRATSTHGTTQAVAGPISISSAVAIGSTERTPGTAAIRAGTSANGGPSLYGIST